MSDEHIFPILEEVVRDSLDAHRRAWASGDILALLQCTIDCAQYELPLPRWATRALARASSRYIGGVSSNMHDAIFGAKRKLGSNSNPARELRTRLKHQLWLDVSTALRREGLEGDELWEKVVEYISGETCLHDWELRYALRSSRQPKPETVKKTVERMQRDGVSPRTPFLHMTIDVVENDVDRQK